MLCGWLVGCFGFNGPLILVGCFGFNGPLRQYFSLYRAVSQREGERGKRIEESKNVQNRWMDDLRFYVLLTVFQSYQDDVWMIMKGCVQWNSVYG